MAQALAKLNSEGHDWRVGGDWIDEPAALFSMQLGRGCLSHSFRSRCSYLSTGRAWHGARLFRGLDEPCIQSCLLRMMAQDVQILRQVPDLPKELPPAAPPGISRYPYEWDAQLLAYVTDTQGLAACMDSLMRGVEREFTN
eukprot:3159726-Pyramimonas_sp.AAC.1